MFHMWMLRSGIDKTEYVVDVVIVLDILDM